MMFRGAATAEAPPKAAGRVRTFIDRFGDPERLGRGHAIAAAVALVLAGAFAVVARLELLGPAKTLMDGAAFRQLELYGQAGWVLLVLLPSPALVGNFVLAERLRSSRGQFRLFVASQLHLVGALAFVAAACSGARVGLALLVIATGLVALGGAGQADAVLRATGALPGRKLSTFGWALRVASVAAIVVLPLVALACAELLLESVAHVGAPVLHAREPLSVERALRFAWAAISVVAALPFPALVADLLAGAARRPVRDGVVVIATCLVATLALAIGLAQLAGDGPGTDAVASAFRLGLLVPATLIGWRFIAVVRGGVEHRPDTWLALASAVLFVLVAAASLPLGMADVAPHLRGTSFEAGVDVLLGAAVVLAAFGGLSSHWSRLAGSAGPAPPGFAIVALVGGVLVVAAAQLGAGAGGLPRGYDDYPTAFQPWQIAATVGAMVVLAAVLATALGLLASLRRRSVEATRSRNAA